MSTHKVRVVHHGDEAHLLHIARVSSDQGNTDPALIGYLMRNKHWSPFEMIGACIEIDTTRDIGRQVLRHRSFSFQEFSQRYSEVSDAEGCREMASDTDPSYPISPAAHAALGYQEVQRCFRKDLI